MFIVTFDSASVNATIPAVVVAARPFAAGLAFRRPFGPSATDLAFEAGRGAGLEMGRPVDPPTFYSAAERGAFLDGVAEASAILDARELDYLAELAEGDAFESNAYASEGR